MHASRLLQLHLPGNYYYEKEFAPSPSHNSKPVTHSQQEFVRVLVLAQWDLFHSQLPRCP